jgi:hypothetical protein
LKVDEKEKLLKINKEEKNVKPDTLREVQQKHDEKNIKV